ncbi:MAG TPA: hypothetical protein P5531_01935 [Bacteroidales bacterium]|nr:hypothetical protein [Bacteroidales bacterium]HSA43053.1 hypothetical protein [Bacteroidales bacterium]
MKKIVPLIIVSVLVLVTGFYWIMQSDRGLPLAEMVQGIIIVLLVLFGFYIAFSRLKSVRRGEPAEDEMSKKILQRAAAVSYYVSLYIWVGIIFLLDRVEMETEVLLGSGILGMGIVWVLLVLFFRWKGLRDA